MYSPFSNRGFTLLETLVATGLLVTALAGIAQLFVLSTHLTRQASTSGMALVSAQDKLESLRGLTFAYNTAGVSITAPGLQPSPASSLDEDVESNVDWLDANGRVSDGADAAAFVRRWRVSAVAASTPDAIAIEVCVFTAPADEVDHRAAEACLSTIRTRQP